MTTIHENLTSQIDGVTDTFTTINDISSGVVIDHNGQVVNTNDITILTPNSFQLSFVPKISPSPTDTLAAFITPELFDVSGQIDGITNQFNKDPSDSTTGDFIAILNGQILVQETITLTPNTFEIPSAPQIGDTLQYFRAFGVRRGTSIIVSGVVETVSINAEVNVNDILGTIEQDTILGSVSINDIKGTVQHIEIKGEVSCL